MLVRIVHLYPELNELMEGDVVFLNSPHGIDILTSVVGINYKAESVKLHFPHSDLYQNVSFFKYRQVRDKMIKERNIFQYGLFDELNQTVYKANKIYIIDKYGIQAKAFSNIEVEDDDIKRLEIYRQVAENF